MGGWGQGKDATVAYRLFEDVGAEATKAIDREAERVTAFFASTRITPRFRTPLEEELRA